MDAKMKEKTNVDFEVYSGSLSKMEKWLDIWLHIKLFKILTNYSVLIELSVIIQNIKS